MFDFLYLSMFVSCIDKPSAAYEVEEEQESKGLASARVSRGSVTKAWLEACQVRLSQGLTSHRFRYKSASRVPLQQEAPGQNHGVPPSCKLLRKPHSQPWSRLAFAGRTPPRARRCAYFR